MCFIWDILTWHFFLTANLNTCHYDTDETEIQASLFPRTSKIAGYHFVCELWEFSQGLAQVYSLFHWSWEDLIFFVQSKRHTSLTLNSSSFFNYLYYHLSLILQFRHKRGMTLFSYWQGQNKVPYAIKACSSVWYFVLHSFRRLC